MRIDFWRHSPHALRVLRLLSGLSVLVALILACDPPPAEPVQLVLGAAETQSVKFRPKSTFAEYLELPGARNELRITIASYDASCDRYVPPPDGEVLITLLITTPPQTRPTTAAYEYLETSAPGAKDERLQRGLVVPTVRLGREQQRLNPGGKLTLTQVELDPRGIVEGQLAFHFAGDVERPTSALTGRFSARLCRVNFSESPTSTP